MLSTIQPLIQANEAIPIGSFCSHPSALVRLDTGSASPVHRRQYLIPFHLHATVEETLNEWEQAGIIEPADPGSLWNSPLLAVPKKSSPGSTPKHRICLDPRPINLLLQDHPTKTPLIQDIFNNLKGSL